MYKLLFILCLLMNLCVACSSGSKPKDNVTGSGSETESAIGGDSSSTAGNDTTPGSDSDSAVTNDSGTQNTCVPSCGTAQCGSDGCGGICGTCGANAICQNGICQTVGNGAVVVDASAELNTIPPEVYGLAYATPEQIAELNVTLNRWGGNSTTRYNWELDVHNVGADWYFENILNEGEGEFGTDGYLTSEEVFVRDTLAAGATTLIAMPTIGWTPKDRVVAHPFTCGFPAAQYPNQDDFDEWDANCGNGLVGGAEFEVDSDNAFNTSKAVGPSYIQDRIENLLNQFEASYGDRTRFYSLDNEMMLWDSTHRDVHPYPVDFEEVWEKTESYAAAIKTADPEAYVMGYGTWGAWDTYEANVEGEADICGMPLMAWYLQQLAEYEATHGVRLIDCVDLHFYPQQDGADNAQVLNSSRSLWDPDYDEESWLKWIFDDGKVRLLPRVREWINTYYPGTEICISEYHFFPANPLDLLVQAEVFGIMGREGVRLASWWTTPSEGGSYWAFRIFRNYDGSGGTFGETVLSAASTIDGLSVFAAKRSSDNAITIVLVNKNNQSQNVTITVLSATATAYTPWTKTVSGSAIETGSPISVESESFSTTIPGQSVQLLVGQ